MCDFAPRDRFDIHAAIRDANIKTAGLLGWPRIRNSTPSGDAGTEARSTPAQLSPDSGFPSAGAAAGEGEGGR